MEAQVVVVAQLVHHRQVALELLVKEIMVVLVLAQITLVEAVVALEE
jgi:hypothetical protein